MIQERVVKFDILLHIFHSMDKEVEYEYRYTPEYVRLQLGVLIAAGIVFAILLTFIVFVIWKYLQKQKQLKLESLVRKGDNETLDKFGPETFKFPHELPIVNCRTFLAQEPTVERPPLPVPGTASAVRNLQRTPTKLSLLSNSESIKSNCDEDFLFSSPTYTSEEEEQQQLIPQTQQIQTPKEKRDNKRSQYGESRRKAIAHRGFSITEDMFAGGVERLNEGVAGNRSKSLDKLSKGSEFRKSFADVVQPLKMKDQPLLSSFQPKGIYKRDCNGGLQQRGLYKRGGKIIFKTKYIEVKRELEVHILKAFDLACTRDMMEITPFVRLCLLPGKKQKQDTKHKKQPTKEPFFNEKIIFQGLKQDELPSLKLNVKVCNHSRVKRKEVLGEAELALSSIDVIREKQFCVTLYQQRYEVTSASVSISACHEATEQRLVAVIHEVHLPKSSGKLIMPNLYASASLYKKDVISAKKEAVLKRITTTSPLYNEKFEFAVYTTTADNLSVYSLDFTLRHCGYVGKGNIIGHVVLSLDSSQKTAEDQWKAVVDMPHNIHKGIHALIDPDEH